MFVTLCIGKLACYYLRLAIVHKFYNLEGRLNLEVIRLKPETNLSIVQCFALTQAGRLPGEVAAFGLVPFVGHAPFAAFPA